MPKMLGRCQEMLRLAQDAEPAKGTGLGNEGDLSCAIITFRILGLLQSFSLTVRLKTYFTEPLYERLLAQGPCLRLCGLFVGAWGLGYMYIRISRKTRCGVDFFWIRAALLSSGILYLGFLNRTLSTIFQYPTCPSHGLSTTNPRFLLKTL